MLRIAAEEVWATEEATGTREPPVPSRRLGRSRGLLLAPVACLAVGNLEGEDADASRSSRGLVDEAPLRLSTRRCRQEKVRALCSKKAGRVATASRRACVASGARRELSPER